MHHGFEVNQKVEWDGNRARAGAAWETGTRKCLGLCQSYALLLPTADIKSSPICCCTFDPVNHVNWYEAESVINRTMAVNMMYRALRRL